MSDEAFSHDLRRFKTLTLDLCCKAIEIGGFRQRLSVSQFAVMDLFTRRPGVLFSRQQIMDAIFGNEAGYYTDRTCDSHIKMLRRQGVTGIVTHYGSGYCWEDRVPAATHRAGMNTRLKTVIEPKPKLCNYCGAPIPHQTEGSE